MDYNSINKHLSLLVHAILLQLDEDALKKSEWYIEKSMQDINYSLLFTIESIRLNQSSILENYYAWLISTLKYYNIHAPIILKMKAEIKKALKPYLSNDEVLFLDLIKDKAIYDLLNLDKAHPLNPAAEVYLSYLLKKDRVHASQYITSLLESGYAIIEIYTKVIQVAMVEIGRLWQTRKINVADEHIATLITQYVMTTLYPHIFKTEKNGLKLVSIALGSELHEIGMRMVTDLFELEGYETHYLGGNTPIETVINYCIEYQPDILAISVTISLHLSTLKQCVDKIRSNDSLKTMKILVGGQALMLFKDPVERFNVDGFAYNAVEALKVGESLVQR